MGTSRSPYFKRASQSEKAQSVSANSCKLMNEWDGSSPEMATEAKTVLGPVTTIYGSSLKIAFYIYTYRLCGHTAQPARAHTHTVAAKWQNYRAKSSGKQQVHTSGPRHCLHSLYLGEQQQKNALYLHPFLWNKEREIVCHETDIPFVLLWELHCMLV